MNYLSETIAIESIREKASERDILIWGAGNQGRGICQILQDNGIALKGFVDRSQEMIGKRVMGLTVYGPEILDTLKDIFVIISVFFYEREISKKCEARGMVKGEDYISYSQLKSRDYSIDVSGACNLKCLSCPRSSRLSEERSPGFMSLNRFEMVLDKIKSEDPFVGNIQLYQWGEPTLNRELPEMIQYAHKKGIKCAISSNLNANVDYRQIIEARPEWFRVSASGWGKNYEIAHTRGDWDRFFKNLQIVSSLRNEFYPDMKIELYYHLYKHSTGESLHKFQNLCADYAVEFHPVYAYLISLDDVLAYKEGIPLPPTAVKASEMMLFDLDEGLDMAFREASLPCDVFRSIHINWDLSVSNCMMYYYPEGNTAADNYLDIAIDEIMKRRLTCSLCKRCIRHGMHRYCGVYSTRDLNIENLISP